MSYEKQTWQSGDTITSEKLNNIENGVAAIRSGEAVPEVEVLNLHRIIQINTTTKQVATFTPVDVTTLVGRSVRLILEDQMNAGYTVMSQSISETSAIESTMSIRTRSTWGDMDYPSVGGVELTVDFESGECYARCYGDATSAAISHIEVVITEAVVPALAEYVAKRYVANVSKSTGILVNATISQLLQDVQAGYDVVIRIFYENSTTYFEDYRLSRAQFDSDHDNYLIHFVSDAQVLSGIINEGDDEWSIVPVA